MRKMTYFDHLLKLTKDYFLTCLNNERLNNEPNILAY